MQRTPLTDCMIALAREGKSNPEIARLVNRRPRAVRKLLSRWRSRGMDIPKGRAKRHLNIRSPALTASGTVGAPPQLILPIKVGVELYRRAREVGARVHLDSHGSIYFDVRIGWVGDPAQLLVPA